MKKYILILIVILLSSCITEKKCSERFPAKTITKDSIVYRTNTVVKDSIIYVKIPVEIGNIEASVKCDSLGAQMNKVILDNKRLKMTVEIINGKLIAVSTCKEDSLQTIIQRYRTTIDSLYNNSSFVQVPQVKFEMKWYEEIFFYIGILASLIITGYLLLNFIKNKLK